MSERRKRSNSPKKLTAFRKLLEDLSEVNTGALPISEADNDMLSLLVDEVIKEIDISKRYPDFYRKLLENHELRRAFLEILEVIELEKNNELAAIPSVSNPELDFLTSKPVLPMLSKLTDRWQISWYRPLEQLRSIFSPQKLAHRSDDANFEDSWFILLRDEVQVDNIVYTIILECTFSQDREEAFSPFLNIAVTVGSTIGRPQYPVQASLQWGTYDESLPINKEGRAKFPDIPFSVIFDENLEKINADLNLIIEPPL